MLHQLVDRGEFFFATLRKSSKTYYIEPAIQWLSQSIADVGGACAIARHFDHIRKMKASGSTLLPSTRYYSLEAAVTSSIHASRDKHGLP